MILIAAEHVQQGGEQVAAGLQSVVDRDRLAGEEQREVEVVLDERLGAEPLRELCRLRVARLAALVEREDARPQRRREEDRGAGQ